MPLYEYKCHKCDAVFEVIQKFSDEPLTVHNGCGGTVERLLSSPAFQFKGSGWYVTDYAKGKSSSSSSPRTETRSETKTETKSEPAKPSEKK